MIIDPESLTAQDASHLLTDIVVPRPIAWVATSDGHGAFNLAPFSAYGMICSKPMMVGFAVSSYRDGKKKDTILNIEATQEFSINIVTEDLGVAMNITSAAYPRDVSEFEKAGLTPVKAELVKAPLVAQSPLNLECRVQQILQFGKTPAITSFIIGAVLRVHLKDDFYSQQSRRVSGLRPIGRLGGDQDLYCRTRDTFEMKRPLPG
jgi:flavin reductase (DIM6/NTAB) family NADH-FMN oxidoreductase RutF